MQTEFHSRSFPWREPTDRSVGAGCAAPIRERLTIPPSVATSRDLKGRATLLERLANRVLRLPVATHYVLASAVAIGFSLHRDNAGILLIFLQGILLSQAFILLMNKEARNAHRIYATALSACSLAMFFTNATFEWNYGIAAAANDELKYFYWFDEALWHYETTGEIAFFRERYLGYFYPLMFFVVPARALGEFDPYFLKYVSFFVCCLVPVLVYRLYRNYFPADRAMVIACLTTLFMPTVLHYGVIGVRDIFFTCTFVLFALVMTARMVAPVRLSLLGAIVTYVWFLRPESAIFLAVAVAIQMFASGVLNGSGVRVLAGVALGLVVLACSTTCQVNGEAVADSIGRLYSQYDEMALAHTRTEAAIRRLPAPLDWTLLASYGVLGTFPPELACRSDLAEMGLVRVQGTKQLLRFEPRLPVDLGLGLRSLGQFIWYFVLAYVLYGLCNARKLYRGRLSLVALQVTGLCYLCTLSVFTFEHGRLHAPYPLLVSFGIATFLLLRGRTLVRRRLFTASGAAVLVLYALYYALRG